MLTCYSRAIKRICQCHSHFSHAISLQQRVASDLLPALHYRCRQSCRATDKQSTTLTEHSYCNKHWISFTVTQVSCHMVAMSELSWVELSSDICMWRRTRCSATTAPDDGSRMLKKAESSAGAWRCSATVRGLVVKEVDCSRLRGRTLRSSAGQWKSELWAREGF